MNTNDRKNIAAFRKILKDQTEETYDGNPYASETFYEGKHEGRKDGADDLLEAFNRLFPPKAL